MTLQEIKELQEKITAEEMAIYREECRIFELEETTTDVVKKMKYVGKQDIKSCCIKGAAFAEIQDGYNSLIEGLGKYHTEPILDGDVYDDYLDTIYFKADIYEMLPLHRVDGRIKDKIRSEISSLLRPKQYQGYTKTVQCEMLTLFMDGKIDWVTLQKITYQGHEI